MYLRLTIFLLLLQSFLGVSQSTKNYQILKQNLLQEYEAANSEDKQAAVAFLLDNMSIHKSVNYRWVDSLGMRVSFSEFDYDDLEVALEAFQNLKDSISIYPKPYEYYDIDTISTEFLSKNIDQSFQQWKTNPWSSTYSFPVFCEYILPYRGLVEPLEMWREDYRLLVEKAIVDVENIKDPVEVATQIILELHAFEFLASRPDPIPILSPQQMLFRRRGSCPDLANLALLACRSIGIAATFDFTPHYGASSNRHYWNSVVDKEGKHIPFDSSFTNDLPYTYQPREHKRLAKVYRKTFSIQKNALASLLPKDSIPESFLKSQNILDVTAEYTPVSDLFLKKEKNLNASVAYLNVFNLNRWRAVTWAKRQNSQFVFKNMGRNLVYLPSVYKNQKMQFDRYPILLNTRGESKVLYPDYKDVFSATLSRKKEIKIENKETNTLEIKEGNRYLLIVWDGGWKRVELATATEEGVHYKKIPANGLFKLISKDQGPYERIFTVDRKTGSMVWY